MGNKRLDVLLVERGLAQSRSQAKQMIETIGVTVNGQTVRKASAMVATEAQILAVQPKYVSRGGLKLEKALQEFPINVSGKLCLDCGASTGGFTDCLLQNGAEHVWAVDVGMGQLAEKLKTDSRVTSLEHINIRYMEEYSWLKQIDVVVMDVSFISVKLILERLFQIIDDNAQFIVLIKPQFEAGRQHLNKHGVVKNPRVHQTILWEILDFIENLGYYIKGIIKSPILGGDGNIEYIVCFDKTEDIVYTIHEKRIIEVVAEAFADVGCQQGESH